MPGVCEGSAQRLEQRKDLPAVLTFGSMPGVCEGSAQRLEQRFLMTLGFGHGVRLTHKCSS